MATTNSNWKANEKQQAFLDLLKENSDGLTLYQASKKLGYELKTGTTNPLINKGLVTAEDCEFKCDIVLTGTTEVVGHTNKKVKRYKLANTNTNED